MRSCSKLLRTFGRKLLMFWSKLKKPIIGLAPMHEVSNSVFRLECKKNGADIVYSEMIAAEAVIRNIAKALDMAKFSKKERPIIIQLFGTNPVNIAEAAKIIENKFKPDGIDLNFGCPVPKAQKQGFGAVQLRDSKKISEICKSVKSVLKNTPISVKMRLVSQSLSDNLIFIEAIKPFIDALVIHGRTLNQLYKGDANWEIIYEIKKHNPDLIVLGNGDIKSAQDFEEKIKNLDGVLIGRAARKNPQIFKELHVAKDQVCR